MRELRQQHKLTQVRLAIDLNMTQNTISRYETEQHQADYKTLILFADYFHVSVDYILGRTDNPTMNT